MPNVGALPSDVHAQAFVRSPNLSTAATLGVDVVARALIIALGMELFRGRRHGKFSGPLAGSIGIELFVVGFVALSKPSP